VGTILGLTGFIGALNLTFRLFTLDFTDCIFGFLTGGSAGRVLANRLAYGRTLGVIALPRT